MNLIDLEAFVAVVDHGSVVAASAVLHLTQSAVTRRIQNLEDSLGVPLLDRQNRPLRPTRAGRETYEFAKPVLSSVSDLKSAIEKAFSADRVTKYLKALDSRKIRIRNLSAIFTADVIDLAAGNKAGTARSLYGTLPVSDQAQTREFYLSKVEDLDSALRAKFHKLYQYY